MNSVNIIGRLVRENDLRYSPSGTAVLKNTIAVNRKFKKDESDFISLIAFGKTAELIANHIQKGEQLGIEGHIQTGSYEKDGRKVYTTDVVADNITFIGNKGTNTSGNDERQQRRENKQPEGDPFGQTDIDGDLPF